MKMTNRAYEVCISIFYNIFAGYISRETKNKRGGMIKKRKEKEKEKKIKRWRNLHTRNTKEPNQGKTKQSEEKEKVTDSQPSPNSPLRRAKPIARLGGGLM